MPTIRRLATPNGMYLGGIDGLARSGAKIVGLQNLIGRGRVWSLTIDAGRSRVTDAKLLLRGHPDLKNPATGAIVGGNRYLFVADPNLQRLLPSGEITPLPAGRRGHRVLELPL